MKLAHAVLGAAVGFSVSVLGASPELAGTAETNYYPSVASGLAPEGEEYFSVCTVYDDVGCPATNINEYVTKGGPKPDVEDGLSDYLRHLDDDGGSCSCSCSEATTIDDLCVYFAQWFGRSALNPEMPVGRLLIREDSPGPKLLSPKCLQYDSPFERKFYGAVIGPALVRRPGRRAAVYYDGLPVLGSSLARSSVEFLLDEDLHRETFADRSSVLYSGSEAVFYVTPQGRRIHRSESGTTVVRGSDGAIRQIYSEADGLIDVATRSDGFTVAWYPPSGVSSVAGPGGHHSFSGDPVKTFAFTATSTNSLSLVESRPGSASRTYSWTWSESDGVSGWTLVSGAGSERRVHRRLHDADGETETVLDNSGAVVSSRRTAISRSPNNNRLLSVASATGRRLLDCSYTGGDALARRVSTVSEEFGATVSYAYDNAGRRTSRSESAAGLPPRVETTAYDAEGRVVSRTDPAGRTTAFAYSADGRTVVETLANGAAKTTVRDAYGRVASVTGSAVTPEWHFRGVDASGEWERTVVGDPDSARATTVWRDGLGRAWREERPGANGSTLETYRLYGWTGQLYDELESGRPTRSYEYDGLGNLVATTLATDLQPDAVACDYVWDPTEPVATRPLVFRTQSQSQLSPTVLYYTHDGNKNVSELVDQNATVAAHYEYAPFGAVTISTGSCAFANPFRFSSEYADDGLMLNYYNYRHYNPLDGRWFSRDMIGEELGVELYSFVGNSPLGLYDIGMDKHGNPCPLNDGSEK